MPVANVERRLVLPTPPSPTTTHLTMMDAYCIVISSQKNYNIARIETGPNEKGKEWTNIGEELTFWWQASLLPFFPLSLGIVDVFTSVSHAFVFYIHHPVFFFIQFLS